MRKNIAFIVLCYIIIAFAGVVEGESLVEKLLTTGIAKKLLPYAKYLPKAFPLLKGKVKSQHCRDNSAEALTRTKEILKISKDLDMSDPSDQKKALGVLCPLGKDCLMEYVDVFEPLLKTKYIQKILPAEFDINLLKMYAEPVYDFACFEEEKENKDMKEDL